MVSCTTALMRPAEFLWERFKGSTDDVRNQTTIELIAQRIIAFLGLIVTAPFYWIGFAAKTVLILFRAESQVALPPPPPVAAEDLPVAPPLIMTAEVREATDALMRLNLLLQNPTWANYKNLPFDQQYLVAGRHTYPTYWGWNFVTKFTLMNAFEGELHDLPLDRAQQGIREAIRLQEKILFVHRFQQVLEAEGDIHILRDLDPETWEQVLYFIAREHGCTKGHSPIDFGSDILMNRGPKHPDTLRGLDCMLTTLKGAYRPNFLPAMNPVSNR